MNAKTEIKKFLEKQNNLSTLKFITCGSVDDGKSTLLGRMLYEAKLIFDDQIESLAKDSIKVGTQGKNIDFSLLVDGLSAEREQGITIDIAHRFFSTEKRKFIVADSPGHEQYTRNMVTAASNADLAIILVDARNGILDQTKRHSFIANLMGIKRIIVAINKMDLVSYEEAIFKKIKLQYELEIESKLDFEKVTFIPVSALEGDNIVSKSKNMPWYDQSALIKVLETVDIDSNQKEDFVLPIQFVNRPNLNFRGYSGKICSGELFLGDQIQVAESKSTSSVKEIYIGDKPQKKCSSGDSITITLANHIDISRGDILTKIDNELSISDLFLTNLIWFDSSPCFQNRKYLLKSFNNVIGCELIKIKNKVNINNYQKVNSKKLEMNDIAECEFKLDKPLALQSFSSNKTLGNFILIDKQNNLTVAAGTIRHSLRRSENIKWQDYEVNAEFRKSLLGQKPVVLWFTGLSGSGKSTISNLLEKKLAHEGKLTYLLDGDNLRHGLNNDLGFKKEDRIENLRRAGEVAKILYDAGIIVLASFISPYIKDRDRIKSLFPKNDFVEIYLKISIEEAKKRDPKGLYAKALEKKIPNFTGISSNYEEPKNPDMVIETESNSPNQAVDFIYNYLKGLR